MAQINYNNQAGTLGTTLTSTTSGTIANFFSVAPDFANVSGADFIKLVLDYGTGHYEIIGIQYSSASPTSALAVTRSFEDSTNWPAVAHNATSGPSGGTAVWACAPTLNDFPLQSDGSPVGTLTPTGLVGQLCVDVSTPALYQANGSSDTDWQLVGGSGGGAPLATVLYGPGTRVLQTFPSGSTLGPIDSTNLTISFVAPANGCVDVEVELIAYNSTGGDAPLTFALFDHTLGTQVGWSWPANYLGGIEAGLQFAMKFHLEGLTGGDSYQYDLAGAETGGTCYVLIIGAQGTRSSVDIAGPVLMRVLPGTPI